MYVFSTKVDWLSFVVPVASVGEGSEIAYLSEFMEATLSKEFGYVRAYAMFSHLQPLGFGRAPYKLGFQNQQRGITVWVGGDVPHMCVEFSGVGCDYLREEEMLDDLIAFHSQRLTRIDIAVDLECELNPVDLVKTRSTNRQKTTEEIHSPTGDTFYVGSRSSERYCRVYRYAPPHPRSNLLRVEMVSRRANAKQVGASLYAAGLASVSRSLLEAFGWNDFARNYFAVESTTVSAYRPERGNGSTLNWLIKQVAPAFQRLVKDGTIKSPEQFFAAYFLPEDYFEEQD